MNGSTIRRASTRPIQSANVTVPEGSGGESGLLGFSLVGESGLPVVVDCSETPRVTNVSATAFSGEYGAGHRIYFKVGG